MDFASVTETLITSCSVNQPHGSLRQSGLVGLGKLRHTQTSHSAERWISASAIASGSKGTSLDGSRRKRSMPQSLFGRPLLTQTFPNHGWATMASMSCLVRTYDVGWN